MHVYNTERVYCCKQSCSKQGPPVLMLQSGDTHNLVTSYARENSFQTKEAFFIDRQQ